MVSELLIGVIVISLVCVTGSAFLVRKLMGNSGSSGEGDRRRKRSKGARRDK